jgi:hypothetical protein
MLPADLQILGTENEPETEAEQHQDNEWIGR